METLPTKRANRVGNGVFLISIGCLVFLDTWWPGIFLAIGASLFTRQFLSGRYYFATLSGAVFLSLFLLGLFRWQMSVLAPVLLITAGIFIVFQEMYFPMDTNGEEVAEEIREDAEVGG